MKGVTVRISWPGRRVVVAVVWDLVHRTGMLAIVVDMVVHNGGGVKIMRPTVIGGRGAERGGSGRRSFEVSGGAVLLIRFVHVRDSGGSGNTAVVDALVFGLFQICQRDERVALA